MNFDFADKEAVISVLRADISETQEIAERTTPIENYTRCK
jgi:hypothetical protein